MAPSTFAKKSNYVKAVVDPEAKRRATEIFSEMGMSMSTAINVFLYQTIKEGRLPFQPGYPSAPKIDHSDPRILHARVENGVVLMPHDWADDDDE